MSDETQPSDHFRRYLADRDEPCPLCGYNLRGLTGDHCPECGKKLMLRVGLKEPALAAYLVGLVALAVGAGFSVLMLAFFLIIMFLFRPSIPNPYLYSTVGGSIVMSPLLLLWLWSGRRIRRWTRATRITLAVVCWIGVVIVFGAFVVAGLSER